MEVGSASSFAALEEPGPEETAFLTLGKLVKRGHCFGPMLCHQLEMVVASHKAHQRQKGKAVPWVALGRWRVERDPTWVLLLLSTWGTKDEDVPSGPALAEGLLCVLELVAKPFCVALIFVPQTEKWRC